VGRNGEVLRVRIATVFAGSDLDKAIADRVELRANERCQVSERDNCIRKRGLTL
jgi:hypothetical protein